jgi:hypothetical protein
VYNYIHNPHLKKAVFGDLGISFLHVIHGLSTSYPQNVDKSITLWISGGGLWIIRQ